MQHLTDLSVQQLTDWMIEQGQPKFRGRQIWRWVYARAARSFEQMTDLPAKLREQLESEFRLLSTAIVRRTESDDGTQKLLIGLHDGLQVECVLLRDDRHHRTACISTQVGCAMGCVFCASGLDGVERNLTTGEIIEQLLQLRGLLDDGERLSHVVVMGMGEPLANLDALLPALEIASDKDGLGIGQRKISISTVGLPAGIRRLADLNMQYNLAVSLHASNDELRNRLIPANRKVGIQAVLEAADYYFEVTGRRITYEYILLAGMNDRLSNVHELTDLLRHRAALINVIPYNPVPGLSFRTPRTDDTREFVGALESAGLTVKVRWRKGDRIDAACGQLRRRSQT